MAFRMTITDEAETQLQALPAPRAEDSRGRNPRSAP